ncbi:MAG: hypothetical protein ACYC77_01940 [Coriobacteriia bacterium]
MEPIRLHHVFGRALLLAALVLLVTAAGCARATSRQPVTPTSTTESTPSVNTMVGVEHLPAATPEGAVVAYLGIVSRAYYSLDSTLVAQYVTDGQWVREDAYIQLNLVQNRAIEMNLLTFQVTAQAVSSAEDTATTLVTAESWKWRYWDLKTRKPKTAWADTSYSVEYTLARQGEGWIVDRTRVIDQSGETTPALTP